MSRLQCLNLKLVIKQILTAGENEVQTRLSANTRNFSKLSNWGTKKSATHVKIVNYHPETMADAQVEQILAPLREAVKKQVSRYRLYRLFCKYIKKLMSDMCIFIYFCQGQVVRSMKESNAPDMEVKKAVGELKALKKQLDDKELALQPPSETFNRSKFADLMIRRFFYDQSFSIYGGKLRFI